MDNINTCSEPEELSITEVADWLDRAADKLLEHGQTRRAWMAADGKVCAGQAILLAANGDLTERWGRRQSLEPRNLLNVACRPVALAYALFLLKKYGDVSQLQQAIMSPGNTIVHFNDNTTTDMMETMRLTAKGLRERAGQTPPTS